MTVFDKRCKQVSVAVMKSIKLCLHYDISNGTANHIICISFFKPLYLRHSSLISGGLGILTVNRNLNITFFTWHT